MREAPAQTQLQFFNANNLISKLLFTEIPHNLLMLRLRDSLHCYCTKRNRVHAVKSKRKAEKQRVRPSESHLTDPPLCTVMKWTFRSNIFNFGKLRRQMSGQIRAACLHAQRKAREHRARLQRKRDSRSAMMKCFRSSIRRMYVM